MWIWNKRKAVVEPFNKQIKKAKQDNRDKSKCLTSRPVQILDTDYVLKILRETT